MGGFGSTIGGIMTMASLFLGAWVTFTFTANMLPLFLFTIFGIVGGVALGSLNTRKARTQAKYKNEYTGYAGMAFAFIVFLGLYYAFIGQDTLESNIVKDEDPMLILFLAILSGMLGLFGVGLTVGNALAES